MGDFASVFARPILRTCMNAFAKTSTQVLVTPSTSQPGMPPFAARGIWTVVPINVQMENGSVLSSEIRTLGIDFNEAAWAIPPRQGDTIRIDNVWYVIDDRDDDGQGGSKLTLKEIR